MDTITHLAGPTIHIGQRIIQRCSICGEKLCDNLNTAQPLNEDGSEPSFPTWEAGRLVNVTGGNPSRSMLLPDPEDMKLPKDSCIELVE